MWFLLTQIFPLMLLATVLGAVLAYWWLRNRQETITEAYDRVFDKLEALGARPEPAAREDYEAGMALISSAVRSLRMPDMDPVHQRIAGVEAAVSGIAIPETDLSPVQDRLEGVETRLNGLGAALSSIAVTLADLRNTDLQPLEGRFAKLEDALSAVKIPEVDLGPLHSGLARLDLTIAGLDRPQTDLGPVQARISEFESRLALLGDRLETAQKRDFEKLAADISGIASGVSAIEMPDLGAIYQRLISVEHAIASFKVPEPNLAPMYDRLVALESAVESLPKTTPPPTDMAPVERRLAFLQEAFLTQAPPDLTPVLDAVQSIEGNRDLEALESRLNAIEYGLAAIHHTLRARPESTATRVDREPRARPAAIIPPTIERPVPAPVAPPPTREADPINTARREDDEANLLVEAAFGDADDLEQINGVGPMLCELLHEIGVFYFWQVAEWSAKDVEWVDGKLMHFKGRILRDNWVGQAKTLAAQPNAARRPGA